VGSFVGVVGGNGPDIRVEIAVRVGLAAIASEGQRLPVWRPGRIAVLKVSGSDLSRGFGGNVENVEMGASAVEIANRVALELQTVDDVGRRRLEFGWHASGRLLLVFCGFKILGLGVAEKQYETGAVGRPLKVIHTLSGVGQAEGFPATAVKEPHLVLASIAGREEGEVFAVGTPTGMRGGDALGGHRNGIAAMGRDHPEALLVLVLLE
jgi:hypothetical protein